MMKSGHQRVRRSAKKVKKPKKKIREVSTDDLLKAASAAMESLDIERAYQAYHQAVTQLQKDNSSGVERATNSTMQILIQVLEKMGELQVSMGDPDVAKEHFVQSLRLLEEGANAESAKSTSFYETQSNLYFYIGQLCLGKEALEAYQRGIRSLEECMQRVEDQSIAPSAQETVAMQESTDDADNDKDSPMRTDADTSLRLRALINEKLSGAYCNLAELYLTDLCEEETAENDCENNLEKALQLKDGDGEPLVDALQTMASLRLSQQERQLEAVPFILRAYEKQRVGSEALATLVGLQGDSKSSNGDDDKVQEVGQAQELLEVEAANNLPEFEFRCQTAKLLLECAELLRESGNCMEDSMGPPNQADECVTAAISVLGSLLAQNDEVVEIWYLTGCAFAAKKPPLTDTAKFYLEQAKKMLTEIQKALKEETQFVGDSERPELEERLKMNATQMSDVQSKLDALPSDEGEDGFCDKMDEA